MESAVTDGGPYTPSPSEYPLDEWAPGRRYRPTPKHPPAITAGAAPGQRARVVTQVDDRDNEVQVVKLRKQVVDRLRLMNARHGRRAWERAHNDPIAPHGLAFFYADHDPQPTSGYRRRICTATRLF